MYTMAALDSVRAAFVGSDDVVAHIVRRLGALDQPGAYGDALLVYGGPGTGKSTLAAALAAAALPLASTVVRGREERAAEMAVEALELAVLPAHCAPHTADGTPRAIRLLILDDLDAIAPRAEPARDEPRDDSAHARLDLVARLCGLLDGVTRTQPAVFVLALCAHPAALAPPLCRAGRLHRQMALRLPAPAERAARALRVAGALVAAGVCSAADVQTAAIGGHGLTICELDGAFARAGHAAVRAAAVDCARDRGGGAGADGAAARPQLGLEALASYVREQRRGRLQQAHAADGGAHAASVPPRAGGGDGAAEGGRARGGRVLPLDRYPGLEAQAAVLRQRVVLPLTSPQTLAAWGVRPSRGVLLHGPAGCGKSALAHAAAAESGANVISVHAAGLLRPVVGASEAAVRALFVQARLAAPCVLILDQLQALAPPRGDDSSSEQTLDRTLSTLLSELDGAEHSQMRPGGSGADGVEERFVVVIAICARPDALDPAILRPGRLDAHVYAGLPDARAREAILRAHAARMPLAADVALAEVAAWTAGFSGAELQNVVQEAGLCCVREAVEAAEAAEAAEVAGAPQVAERVTRAHFEEAMSRCHSLGALG
jgi:transitional endoplasmic reticulum ATPase